ncbi:MAG: heme ABC transporter permease CcmC [Gammaproteobacteria bacterium]|nr:heme ABC transporter permease CcmC [Gammaproteobacteria bacterium]
MGWIKTTFHKTGSPRWFFTGARPWVVGLYVFGALLIVVGSTWGLGFVPPERLQGNSVRILFIHAPAAHLAEAIYVSIAIAGFVFLVWRMKMADMLIQAAAPIGFVVTVLALATGIIWGIPTWGTGWVWDARTVSTLLLAFLFFGLVALRQAIGREDRASRAVALLALVGVVNIPIIKYSVEWFTTLHQPPSIEIGRKLAIAPVFLVPLAVNVLGFYCFVAGVVIAALRARIVEREAGAQWLRDWTSKS